MHRTARIIASLLLLAAVGNVSGINRALKIMDGVSLLNVNVVECVAS